MRFKKGNVVTLSHQVGRVIRSGDGWVDVRWYTLLEKWSKRMRPEALRLLDVSKDPWVLEVMKLLEEGKVAEAEAVQLRNRERAYQLGRHRTGHR